MFFRFPVQLRLRLILWRFPAAEGELHSWNLLPSARLRSFGCLLDLNGADRADRGCEPADLSQDRLSQAR